MTSRRSVWILALAGVVTGCLPDDVPPPEGERDAGTEVADGGPVTRDAGPRDGGPPPTKTIELDVSAVFAAGTTVRDAYSNSTGTVDANGMVSLAVDERGLVLIERADAAESTFTWDNATVYFVVLDRFFNGDTSNDNAYGRELDGDEEVATFHGGDLVGLTQKLDHIESLGATAIWITPIVQQIGGWTPGGGGAIKSYPYHGYWALDFTKLDESFGTRAELASFVEAAHDRGIRVVVDVVMNHPGYGTLQDIQTYVPEAITDPNWASWTPGTGQTWFDIFDFVDFDNAAWDTKWWGPNWVRADLGQTYGYSGTAATNAKLGQVAFLPDFKTEDFRPSGFSPLLAQKADTDAVELDANATVRDYLVSWHAQWVRDFGIDGFRIDTAKHVELASWSALKTATTDALTQWKTENSGEKLDDLPFWMVGEVFPPPQGLEAPPAARTEFRTYFSDGDFDALINFDFNSKLKRDPTIVEDPLEIEALYEAYDEAINTDPDFSVMTYISSHDTYLFFEETGADVAKQRAVGTWLLMMPGPVQVYYGDETGRRAGPDAGEEELGTRSDMNWDAFEGAILDHWQRVGNFRKRHVAIGAGRHARIPRDLGYAFSRSYSEGGTTDEVMVIVLDPSELE